MSFINNNSPHIIVDDDFLSLPEIKDAKNKFKSEGLIVSVIVLERLVHRKGRIGMYKNLERVARYLGMHVRRVIKIIDECGVFVADHKHGLFYSPRLRKHFHMPLYVSKSEAEDIAANGNVYLGWCKRHSRQGRGLGCPEDKKEADINDKTPITNITDTETSEKDSRKITECLEKQPAKSTDNQAKCESTKSKGRIFKSKRRIYREFRKQVSSFSVSVADDDDFNIKDKFKMPEFELFFTSYHSVMPKNNSPGINTG